MNENTTNLSKIERDNILQICDSLKNINPEMERDINKVISYIESKRYGLIYEEHIEKADKESVENVVSLEEFKEINELENKNSFNFLLEGDNLHSLRVLEKTHKNKIDFIYIDPPYNTLHEDFVYGDKMMDENDGYKHSKWISFMKSRLTLARKLLTSTGVIFISIDDNEQAQLKLLCDEIFLPQNFLGTIIQDKKNSQNDATNIQKNHDYIHVYRKEKLSEGTKEKPVLYNRIEKTRIVYKDEYGFYYKNGGIVTGGEGGTLNRRPNLGYSIYYNPKTQDRIAVKDYDTEKAKRSNDLNIVYTDDEVLVSKGYKIIRPPKKGNLLGAWTWSLDKFNDEKDKILITKNKDSFSVIKKQYVDSKLVTEDKNKYFYHEEKYTNSKSVITYQSASGTRALTDVLDESKVFNNPKSIEMIKYFISLHPNKNATVLDFFAGSGTTGQAVLELNEEDGGNRKFILCTNNEITADKTVDYLHDNGYMKDYNPGKTAKSKTILNKINKFLKENENVREDLFKTKKADYEKYGICQSITFPRLKVIMTGIRTNGSNYNNQIKSNLKYMKVILINKNPVEDFKYRICEGIESLIELENHIDIGNDKIKVIWDSIGVDELINSNCSNLKTLYIDEEEIELGNKQRKFLDELKNKGVKFKDIPKYYYKEVM